MFMYLLSFVNEYGDVSAPQVLASTLDEAKAHAEAKWNRGISAVWKDNGYFIEAVWADPEIEDRCTCGCTGDYTFKIEKIAVI